MKAKVIDQEGQTLVVELENGVKRVIKIDRAVDLRGKEVFLVREGGVIPTIQPSIEYTWYNLTNFGDTLRRLRDIGGPLGTFWDA